MPCGEAHGCPHPLGSGSSEIRDCGMRSWGPCFRLGGPLIFMASLRSHPPIGVKLFLKKCVKSNIPAEVGETPGAPPVDTGLSEAYNHCMKIGFDPTKRDKTLKERGLDFEDTPDLFSSLRRITYTDNRKDYGELREVTMGRIRGALGRGGSHSAWGSAKNHLNEKSQCQRNPLV